MKKLLSLLGAFGLTATASATVVACGETKEEALTLSVGQTGEGTTIDAKVNEKEYKSLAVTSSDAAIATATVSEKGLITVTALKEGKATLTLKGVKIEEKPEDEKAAVEIGTYEVVVTAAKEEEKPATPEAPTLVDLGTLFTAAEKTLGEVENNAEATTKVNALLTAKAIDVKEVTVAAPANNKIIVSAIKDSTKYDKTVEFAFTVKAPVDPIQK